MRGDERAAGAPSPASVSRTTAAARRQKLRQARYSRPREERPPQPLVKQSVAAHDRADRRVLAGNKKPQEAQDNRRARVPGTRRSDEKIHQGSGPAFGRQAASAPWLRDRRKQIRLPAVPPIGPARADRGRDIRAPRDCRTEANDCHCRSSCRARVVIGPAAPARLPRGLVHDDSAAAPTRRTAAASPAIPAPMTWTCGSASLKEAVAQQRPERRGRACARAGAARRNRAFQASENRA